MKCSARFLHGCLRPYVKYACHMEISKAVLPLSLRIYSSNGRFRVRVEFARLSPRLRLGQRPVPWIDEELSIGGRLFACDCVESGPRCYKPSGTCFHACMIGHVPENHACQCCLSDRDLSRSPEGEGDLRRAMLAEKAWHTRRILPPTGSCSVDGSGSLSSGAGKVALPLIAGREQVSSWKLGTRQRVCENLDRAGLFWVVMQGMHTTSQYLITTFIKSYRVIPGERNCEIETAVWIWPVSYFVLQKLAGWV